jgi:hypothetical protein
MPRARTVVPWCVRRNLWYARQAGAAQASAAARSCRRRQRRAAPAPRHLAATMRWPVGTGRARQHAAPQGETRHARHEPASAVARC